MLHPAILNHSVIMLDYWRARQDGVGGPKGTGLVNDYPQTGGYNVGTMINYEEQWAWKIVLHIVRMEPSEFLLAKEYKYRCFKDAK